MTINKTTVRAAVVILLAACAALSLAQGGGGRGQGQGRRMGMMGQGSALQTLQRADVQRDLNITPEQKTKLEALQTQQREAMQAMFQGGGGGGDREAMQAEMQKMQAEYAKKVNEILTPEQAKRLGEIRIQLAGNRAVMDPENQKALGMTEQQIQQIRDLQAKQREAQQALMEKMRNQEIDREQFQAANQKNNEVMNAELGKILTDAQKAKLKEMAGKEFKADPPRDGGR